MWLILANALDPVGPWLAAGLSARTLMPVQRITDLDLSRIQAWELDVECDQPWVRIELADGRWLDSREILGFINRLQPSAFVHPPPALRGPNHARLVQEIGAVFLTSLGGAVCAKLSSPGAHDFSRNSHHSEWLMLAAAAGLPIRSRTLFARSFDTFPPRSDAHDRVAIENRLLIIGENVLHLGAAEGVPRSIRSAAIRFANAAQNQILELHFRRDGSDAWILHQVQPCSDLRSGGDAALDALASALLSPVSDSQLECELG